MVKFPNEPINLKNIIAMHIVRYRERAALTQKELGIKIGYREENAQARVYQHEKGLRSPSKKTLGKYAQALGITVDALIRSEDRVPPIPDHPAPVKRYPTELEKELVLLCEDALKYGVENIRTLRKLMPMIFKDKKK